MRILTFSSSGGKCRNPTLRECEDETHTFKIGTWESSVTPKTSKLITGVKTPYIGVFFISLERYQSVDFENALHRPFGHLYHKLWQEEGPV